jgi:hypothetical protein
MTTAAFSRTVDFQLQLRHLEFLNSLCGQQFKIQDNQRGVKFELEFKIYV